MNISEHPSTKENIEYRLADKRIYSLVNANENELKFSKFIFGLAPKHNDFSPNFLKRINNSLKN